MGFLSRFFSKSAEECLAKGDALLDSQRFFEARTMFEDGLQALSGKGKGNSGLTAGDFASRIARANRSLAELNIGEAESAIRRGAFEKANEHLELARSLTDDRAVQDMVRQLLASLDRDPGLENKALPPVSGGSCDSCRQGEADLAATIPEEEPDMSPQDYYDLLIRQLPEEISTRYARFGEDFRVMYLAASRDNHENALVLLEEWYKGTDADIYLYEKGMILYRLGRSAEAETCFRTATGENPANPLPLLSLALLLIEGQRLEEAGQLLDDMIAGDVLYGQALMLRGDVALLSGDRDGALNRYAMLLTTPYVRQAAEKLHEVLLQSGRDEEAAVVFKKYLGGCRH